MGFKKKSLESLWFWWAYDIGLEFSSQFKHTQRVFLSDHCYLERRMTNFPVINKPQNSKVVTTLHAVFNILDQ